MKAHVAGSGRSAGYTYYGPPVHGEGGRSCWARSDLPAGTFDVLSLNLIHFVLKRQKIPRTSPGRILGPTECKAGKEEGWDPGNT